MNSPIYLLDNLYFNMYLPDIPAFMLDSSYFILIFNNK